MQRNLVMDSGVGERIDGRLVVPCDSFLRIMSDLSSLTVRPMSSLNVLECVEIYREGYVEGMTEM